jgi:hypothetical protein
VRDLALTETRMSRWQQLMKLSEFFDLGGDQGFALPDTVQLAAKLKVFFCCSWSHVRPCAAFFGYRSLPSVRVSTCIT